jgi:hypothetical protein
MENWQGLQVLTNENLLRFFKAGKSEGALVKQKSPIQGAGRG